jgi:hypothetical protein
MFLNLLTLALLCCPLTAQGQTPTTTSGNVTEQWPTGYSFALVIRSKVLTVEGDWRQSESLRAYSSAHPGNYIVFSNKGSLMLLQEPSKTEEAAKLYIPVQALGEQQATLEAKQTPLNQQQALLGKQMKDARSAEEMRRIGAEQGKIGAEQGAIGREQGQIGQEQGLAGRAFYNSVQRMLTRCLNEQSCPSIPKS